MPSKMCFKTTDGRRICVPIYYERVKFPLDPPGPDPRWFARIVELLGPRPEPWIIDERITPEVRQDIEVLAAINSMLPQASPQLRETMQRTIQNSLAEQSLPEDVVVELEQLG